MRRDNRWSKQRESCRDAGWGGPAWFGRVGWCGRGEQDARGGKERGEDGMARRLR